MSGGVIVAIDTATTHACVALARDDGTVLASRTWPAGHGHSESLLPTLESLLHEAGVRVRDRNAVAGVAAGIGPGSFTGLRVGLATAKVTAYALGVPVVGVDTPVALALADSRARAAASKADARADESAELLVLLPAGPSGIYVTVVRTRGANGIPELAAEPQAISRDAVAKMREGRDVIAVDLPADVAGSDAAERGATAVAGLADALVAIAAQRLAARDVDDVAELVPAYVTLPRGVRDVADGVAWSPALR